MKKEYDADYEDMVGDSIHKTNDGGQTETVETELVETDTIGADGETHTKSYHTRQPEPEQAATLAAKTQGKRSSVAFAAIYGAVLIALFIVAAVVLIYWKSGSSSSQNANMTVDKRRTSNSASSGESSDPTYEEAASLIKPSASPTTQPLGSQTPLPNGSMPPPPTNPTNSILGDQTTGYGLGGTDYVYPKPALPNNGGGGGSASQAGGTSPKFNSASAGRSGGGGGSSNNGGGGNESLVQIIRPLSPPPGQIADSGNSGLTENKDGNPINEILSGATRGGGGGQTSLYYHGSSLSASEQRNENSAIGLRRNAVLPFGTVLPVRMLGALHSLQNQALARMELTRAVSGNGFFLPRGTQFVGRVSGGTANRIFVSLLGYIDNSTGNLVSISGDVLNIDGSIGIAGKRQQLGSRWKKIFTPAIDIARQFGLAYLQSRSPGGTIAVIPQSAISPVLGETNRENQNNAVFVSVAAGASAYVFINGLPTSSESALQRVAADNLPSSASQDLRILTGDALDIQKNLERLSPELRQIAARPNN